ncbi:hypothetical protein BHE74_00015086 [Ensete ventricosum]|nr:hypothetical protein BHE74_00015086 [Ensete ventricosum]
MEAVGSLPGGRAKQQQRCLCRWRKGWPTVIVSTFWGDYCGRRRSRVGWWQVQQRWSAKRGNSYCCNNKGCSKGRGGRNYGRGDYGGGGKAAGATEVVVVVHGQGHRRGAAVAATATIATVMTRAALELQGSKGKDNSDRADKWWRIFFSLPREEDEGEEPSTRREDEVRSCRLTTKKEELIELGSTAEEEGVGAVKQWQRIEGSRRVTESEERKM